MTEIIDLKDAAYIVQSGSTLALGGMTLYRRPTAFVFELLRRQDRPYDLTLLTFTAGYESDLLVGAGCVRRVRTVYFGLEAFGLAPMFTQAAQRGDIEIVEETEASIVLGLRARMSGVGFMPSHAWIGTDLPALRPDVRQIADPYSGEALMAFPALQVDVVVLHGLAADREGNILLNNNLGIDLELTYAAEIVIVTVERLIDQVEKSPQTTILPNPGADYIAVTENGAWPSSCYPHYHVDGLALMDYVEACNAGAFDEYLRKVLS